MTKTSDAAATYMYITCIKHKTKQQFLTITEFHSVKLQVFVDNFWGGGTGGDIQMKIILKLFFYDNCTLNIEKLHGYK